MTDEDWLEGGDLDVAEDDGEGSSEGDDWDMCAVPKLFTTKGARRLFRIQKTVRVGGSHRPTFEYLGYVVELAPLSESDKVKAVTSSPQTETVVERNLTLSLRYEPPSPKFKQQCPLFASYRLKVSRGSEFVYSTRGMESQLTCDKASLVAVWGNLELAFIDAGDLGNFLSALKYVKVVERLSVDHPPCQGGHPASEPTTLLALPAPPQAWTSWRWWQQQIQQSWSSTTPWCAAAALAVVAAATSYLLPMLRSR
mmetsp:Transcript_50632/g.96683  ORF Transcript_50632/g.96683 Transcript_50632/m.96683 type:complete len:254 (-) Transcript_50632:614-1375(-)|eukprot:CAMPEP_0114254074 /NCGR_PEP_ID=MMETSP0058-20121206/16770_1 /TAXON_ID=36894 /ORGANISM="Pyramimonas parkeae, CCMP726" /LENGTH=253 /DNA_ID=CAMNT_0001368239 /DNA_START=187 /DNA_END=951 /DNA_ORIENTATION=-